MKDQELHSLVRESLATIQPEYNPGHWELMKLKLQQELPPPSASSGFLRFLLLGILVVLAIALFLMLRSELGGPANETDQLLQPVLAPEVIKPAPHKSASKTNPVIETQKELAIDHVLVPAQIIYDKAEKISGPISP